MDRTERRHVEALERIADNLGRAVDIIERLLAQREPEPPRISEHFMHGMRDDE